MCCIGTQAWPRAHPRPADRGGRVVASGPLLKRSHSVPLPSIHEVSDELGKARAGDQATSAPPGRGPLPHPEHSRVSGPPSPGAPCLRSGSAGRPAARTATLPVPALPPAPVRASPPPWPRSASSAFTMALLPPARPPPRLAPGSRRPSCSLSCSSVTCRHASLSLSLSPRDLFCDVCLLVSTAVPTGPPTHPVGPASPLRPVRSRCLPVLCWAPTGVSWAGIGSPVFHVGVLHRLSL